MGLFALSKERRRLARMRRQLKREPRPLALADLARSYMSIGLLDEASDVVKFSRSRFPGSLEVQKVSAQLVRLTSNDELTVAKEAARKDPSPRTFLEVAGIYRTQGQIEQCASTLQELVDRFGENATALALLGEVRYTRFLNSLATSHGEAAENGLRRALNSDPEAVRPRYLLAEFFLRIGAYRQASEEAVTLVQQAPGHERGVVIQAEAARRIEHDRFAGEPLSVYLSDVEASVELPGPDLPWDRGGSAEADEGVEPKADAKTEVWRTGRESKAHAAVLIDRDGERFSAGCSEDAALEKVLAGLASMCERASRGMEIGPPARLRVEGDDRVCVVGLRGGAALGLVLNKNSNVDRSAAMAEDALECVVGS